LIREGWVNRSMRTGVEEGCTDHNGDETDGTVVAGWEPPLEAERIA
jgi:hypothetical protein